MTKSGTRNGKLFTDPGPVSLVINRADCDLAGVTLKAIVIRSEHGAVEVVIISIESIMVGLIISS